MATPAPKWLVIGYGSEFHGDDAAGPAAARTIETWQLDGVRIKIMHQLTPEIAEDVSNAGSALFLDASTTVREAVLRPIAPDATTGFSPHAGTPETILALAAALYGRHPSAWLAAIPASNFELGAPLSETTSKAVQDILLQIRHLLANQGPTGPNAKFH